MQLKIINSFQYFKIAFFLTLAGATVGVAGDTKASVRAETVEKVRIAFSHFDDQKFREIDKTESWQVPAEFDKIFEGLDRIETSTLSVDEKGELAVELVMLAGDFFERLTKPYEDPLPYPPTWRELRKDHNVIASGAINSFNWFLQTAHALLRDFVRMVPWGTREDGTQGLRKPHVTFPLWWIPAIMWYFDMDWARHAIPFAFAIPRIAYYLGVDMWGTDWNRSKAASKIAEKVNDEIEASVKKATGESSLPWLLRKTRFLWRPPIYVGQKGVNAVKWIANLFGAGWESKISAEDVAAIKGNAESSVKLAALARLFDAMSKSEPVQNGPLHTRIRKLFFGVAAYFFINPIDMFWERTTMSPLMSAIIQTGFFLWLRNVRAYGSGLAVYNAQKALIQWLESDPKRLLAWTSCADQLVLSGAKHVPAKAK